MRPLLLILGCVVVIGACASSQQRQPFMGTLPKGTVLDMTGTFTFTSDGELQLSLAKPCTVENRNAVTSELMEIPCSRVGLGQIQVIAHTPWNQDIPGTWSDAAHITFRVD